MRVKTGLICVSALAVIFGSVVFGFVRTAHAQLETTYSITLQTDLRYIVQEKTTRERIPRAEALRNPWLQEAWRTGQLREITLIPHGFSRNENRVKFKAEARGRRVRGVADVDLVMLGYNTELTNLPSMTQRNMMDPFRIEAHALYVDILGLGTEKLDLRIGQQIVNWGTADQFNPTSNLNPLNLEDRLMFGDLLATPMVRADFAINLDWNITAAWVPIFRPNLLPRSASLGLASPDRIPIVEDHYRWQLSAERYVGEILTDGPTRVTEARLLLPDTDIKNSQVGVRIRGRVLKQDISFSYYYGRSKMPQPVFSKTFMNPDENIIQTRVDLAFPRMHVIGFDMAGQIPWARALRRAVRTLEPVGWWFEAGVFFPQRMTMALFQENFGIIEDGEYDYSRIDPENPRRPTVVDNTPFLKWVLGFDYTFSQNWWANVQWVHGFPDEFGAGDWLSNLWAAQQGWAPTRFRTDEPSAGYFACMSHETVGECAHEWVRPRISDYLVTGVDYKFYRDAMLLRLFFIIDMGGVHERYFDGTKRVSKWHHPFSKEGYSVMLYPQYTWSLGQGAELSAGGLIMLGRNHTRFGDPAAGSSMVWTRARFAF